MDNLLISSVIIIFFTALIGSYLQRKRRDGVLQELEGFQVTIKFKEQGTVWGKFKLFPKGMELLFSRAYQNRHTHKILSYIIFPNDIERIEAILRFHDELSPENKAQRLKEIDLAKNPRLFTRMARIMTNFLSAFHDAINESLGILISRVKSTTGSSVLQSNDKKLQQLGANALNIVDHSSWDPILEYYLFKKVVLEIVDGSGKVMEYSGILKDYSSSWMAILDCQIDEKVSLPLSDAKRLMLQRRLDFWIRLEKIDEKFIIHIEIKNESDRELELLEVKAEGYSKRIGVVLQSGESVKRKYDDLPSDALKDIVDEELPVEISLIGPERVDPKVIQEIDVALPRLYLEYKAVQSLDVFVHRSIGVIRHRCQAQDDA